MFQKLIGHKNQIRSLIWTLGIALSTLTLSPLSRADDLTDYLNYLNSTHRRALGDSISRIQARLALLEDVSLEACTDYDNTPVGWTNRLLCIVEAQVTRGGKIGKYTQRITDLGITVRAEINHVDQIYLANRTIGNRYTEQVWICTSSCSSRLNFNRALWAEFDKNATGKIVKSSIAAKTSIAFSNTGDYGLLATLNLIDSPKTLDIKAYMDLPDSAHAGDFDKFTFRATGNTVAHDYQLNLTMNRIKSDGNPGHIKLALANGSAGNLNGDILTYLEISGGGANGSKIKAIDAAGTSRIPTGDTSCIKTSEILSRFEATLGTSCGNLTVNPFDIRMDDVTYSKITAAVDEYWESRAFTEHPSSI